MAAVAAGRRRQRRRRRRRCVGRRPKRQAGTRLTIGITIIFKYPKREGKRELKGSRTETVKIVETVGGALAALRAVGQSRGRKGVGRSGRLVAVGVGVRQRHKTDKNRPVAILFLCSV